MGIKEASKSGEVAHPCNPSYLGERDQEDQVSRPVRANSFQDPISKITRAKMD
jgi:hypothetical protein